MNSGVSRGSKAGVNSGSKQQERDRLIRRRNQCVSALTSNPYDIFFDSLQHIFFESLQLDFYSSPSRNSLAVQQCVTNNVGTKLTQPLLYNESKDESNRDESSF